MTERVPRSLSRTRAVAEVIGVFILALLAVAAVTRSPAGEWQRRTTPRPFLEYLAMGAVALGAMALSRRWWEYGMAGQAGARQLDAAVKCVAVFAVGKAALFFLGPRQAMHSLAEPIVVIGVIAGCAWLLGSGKAPPAVGALLLIPAGMQLSGSALVFYPLFLGPAEELLFRGFIQSRLTMAFGRPWRTAGAAWGPGLILASVLFALFHVVNLPALFALRWEPLWVLAVPTFAWGAALGYLRERTDGLLAPILAHGVPQGIAFAVLGR